jgi:hypothetical protein
MKKSLLKTGSSLLGISALLLIALGGSAMAYSEHCTPHAPEIDPSLLGSGLALLVSSAMVVIERYRKR